MTPTRNERRFSVRNDAGELVPDFTAITLHARNPAAPQYSRELEDDIVAEVEDYCDHINFRARTGR